MPGARMDIVNRVIFIIGYFQITKPSEPAGKYSLIKDAAAGLVEYIAARESTAYRTLLFTHFYAIKQ